MSARLTGELSLVGPGRLGIKDDTGTNVVLVWPRGYATATSSPPQLLDSNGAVVAKLGERIRVDGGQDTSGVWRACEGSVFVAP